MNSSEARSQMVDRFVKLATQDPRVMSVFLGGSLADGTEDEYSDIDIYYLVDEKTYPEFHSRIPERLEEFGRLVFLEQHRNFGFDIILFVYNNGVKGELGLGTTKNMMNMHAGPYKVLLDKKGALDGLVFPFGPMLKGDELRKYVEEQLRWYWYWYWVFLSAVARGSLWSALSQFELMRDYAFKLLVLVYNPEKYPDRFTRWIPPTVRDELGKSVLPEYDARSLFESVESLTRIIKREIQGLLESTGALVPAELEATVQEKKGQVLKKMGRT